VLNLIAEDTDIVSLLEITPIGVLIELLVTETLVVWDAALPDTGIELKILEVSDKVTDLIEVETISLLLVEVLTGTTADCRALLLDIVELVTAKTPKLSVEVLGTGDGDTVSLLEILIKVLVELLDIETLVISRMSLLTTEEMANGVPNEAVDGTVLVGISKELLVDAEAPTDSIVLTAENLDLLVVIC